MPNYAQFFKHILSNKCKLDEYKIIMLTDECSARLKNKLPHKLKDLGSFIVPCIQAIIILIKLHVI